MEIEAYEKRGYLLEDFRLFHLRDAGMEPVGWHYHDFHKLVFFLAGEGGYAVEGQRYELAPGDVVLVGRGDVHRPEVGRAAPYERAVLYLSPDFLRVQSGPDCDLESLFTLARREFRFVLRPAVRDGRIPALLAKLERALAGGEEFGQALLGRALLLELLVEIGRGQRAHRLFYVRTAGCDETVVAILRYLGEHLTERLTVEELAARFYLSKYHMMRRFREETGYTIHGYLTGKRLMRARELMAAGETAAAACRESGFRDYSAFLRAYRRQFGRTPRQARAESDK